MLQLIRETSPIYRKLSFHSSSKSTTWYQQHKAPVLQAGPREEIMVPRPPLHLPQVISVGVTGKQKGALFGQMSPIPHNVHLYTFRVSWCLYRRNGFWSLNNICCRKLHFWFATAEKRMKCCFAFVISAI